MPKMSFEEMMDWSSKVKDYSDSKFNFLKFSQGVHCIRILTPEDQPYFRAYTQHDSGQDKEFRSWMCWDHVMDNPDVREYLDEKGLLKEEDAKKAKKYGCPVCAAMDAIGKYVKDMELVYKALRTKTRCIMNVVYIAQVFPKIANDNTPQHGQLYVLEQSAAFNKLIINAMNKQASIDGEDPLNLISYEEGKILAVQADGEGIGKNRRTYTIDFKGESEPVVFCSDGSNPIKKENRGKRVSLPEEFELYDLREVEALRFMRYQDVINQMKSIGTIRKIMEQIGYEVPGDEPSDNPLDDNYDETYAKKTVGKPISKNKTALDSLNEYNGKEMKKFKEKEKEEWEDEEVIKKEKKMVQSRKPVLVADDEDDEVPWDDEEEVPEKENAFTKAVPKSDPKLEVVKPSKGKRKIF
jgi:hypothetical protein